jgi:hypothetical protein
LPAEHPAARIAELEAAIKEIVATAEALSRPGVVTGSTAEVILASRMSNAVQAAAQLVGDDVGIWPELAS